MKANKSSVILIRQRNKPGLICIGSSKPDDFPTELQIHISTAFLSGLSLIQRRT